jgi:chromosome segregation ATPase
MLVSGEIISQTLSALVSAETPTKEVPTVEPLEVLPKIEFAEHIIEMLKRRTNIPTLKSNKEESATSEELLQLVLNTTEVLKQEYLQKQELAAKTLGKRTKALNSEMQVQQDEVAKCLRDEQQLIDGIKQLTSKHEHAQDRQERLTARLDKLLDKLLQTQPGLSEAELTMKTQLLQLIGNLTDYRNGMEQIESKYTYQADTISKTAPQDRLVQQRSSTAKSQLATIQRTLENESTSIFHLVTTINHVKQNLPSAT